jgi:hypothetical protein
VRRNKPVIQGTLESESMWLQLGKTNGWNIRSRPRPPKRFTPDFLSLRALDVVKRKSRVL